MIATEFLAQQTTFPCKAPRRPNGLPSVEAVWAANCAHCGLSAGQLDRLGIARTRQHVVPFKDLGDAGPLIPLCAWCQQDSAAQLRRMTALVTRLTDTLRQPNGAPGPA